MLSRARIALLCLLVSLLLSAPAFGQESEAEKKDRFDSVEAVIRLLEDKGVISPEEAEEFINRHRDKALPEGMSTEEEVYLEKAKEEVADDVSREVNQNVKKQIVRALAQRSAAFSSDWANRIRWGGDVRIRYQADLFSEGNIENLEPPLDPDPNDPSDDINTTEDRHRARIRARLGVRAAVNDQVEAGVRIATGNEEDPVSTNDNLGDYNNKDNFLIDRAYLRWEPYPDNPFTDFVSWAGRIPNPFFATSLVWDSDVNPEGAAVNFKTQLTPTWDVFANAGIFSIQEVEQFQDDKWMYALQTGLEYTREDVLKDIDTFRAKLGLAYYRYENMIAKRNEASLSPPFVENPENDPSAPLFVQKGNTMKIIDFDGTRFETGLAADYHLLNLTGEFDVGVFDPYHVVLSFDYVRNIGYDEDEVEEALLGTGDYKAEVDGYSLGLAVGIPEVRVFKDWRVYLGFKRLERDAVLDAFTDSDFHLGGTNAEGWVLGAEFGLLQNVWLSAKWISADEITQEFQPAFFGQEGQLAVDTFQFDLNGLF